MNSIVKAFFGSLLLIPVLSCKRNTQTVLAPEYLHHESGSQVITSLINIKKNTIAIIYGNDRAVQFARSAGKDHQPGERYVMVTSKQKPMPNWYGANMNGGIISIETVNIIASEKGDIDYDYRRTNMDSAGINDDINKEIRIKFITSQPAAAYP